MEQILGSFGVLFSIDSIIGLLVGVLGGMLIGALPGFSASMGVAILIPVTFGMSPAAGLIMLVSVYTSAIYGGSITATLCNTPGTPASAATAIDGYQLTTQGKGMKALGIVTISSAIGGVIGALALLFLAPPLGQFSLRFSSLEFFMMALFGITIIGSLAGDSLIKGIMSGVIGIFLGTIGLDLITGIPRFTFGIMALEDGIQFVPALIGLFSISQVMIYASEIKQGKGQIVTDPSQGLSGSIWPTKEEFKFILPTIIRSSIIGTIIGIIPAAGAGISSWVNYGISKNMSKKPEMFGNGALDGIAASESGNNAATGGSLIPLLTLGLPGSAVAAILLGGLMIHGLYPGAELFTTFGDITYAVILGFLLANILMGVFGMLVAKQVAKVSMIPTALLGPVIVALSTVGTYAIRNSMFDVTIMLIFGLVGYFMKKGGFAASPLILGLVLEPILEGNYRRALILSRGDIVGYFFTRPISIVIAILVLASLFAPTIMKRIDKNAKG